MTTNLRSIKPFYGPGDHRLWSDIVSDLTPLQAFHTNAKYDDIALGLEANVIGINYALNNINVMRITAFANKCAIHWEFKASVAEMFTMPSQRGIIH